MKTFVVLIPAEGSLVEPRNVCEFLEGTKYDIGGSVQATSTDVLKEVLFEFDLNDYYFSYVYA